MGIEIVALASGYLLASFSVFFYLMGGEEDGCRRLNGRCPAVRTITLFASGNHDIKPILMIPLLLGTTTGAIVGTALTFVFATKATNPSGIILVWVSGITLHGLGWLVYCASSRLFRKRAGLSRN
ncbi:MAG TPA: hypothetical protein VJG48_01795 [Candidatus Paceibacterota bacterium]